MPASSGENLNRLWHALFAVITSGIGAAMSPASANSAGLPVVQLNPMNAVPNCVTSERLMEFLRSRNSKLPSQYNGLATHYARYGEKIGVRWDIGFFQMMVETGNLTFRRPDGSMGDVLPENNNFAGLGAIGDGRPGEVFATQIQGVRAHLEHVLHYSGVFVRAPVAERTRLVQKWQVLAEWHKGFHDRPITFGDVARRWAPKSDRYRTRIENLATLFQQRYCAGQPLLMVEANGRAPEIAQTAWRFRRMDGSAGMAGVIPPTGTPDLVTTRGALGVGTGVPNVFANQSVPRPPGAAPQVVPSPSIAVRPMQQPARPKPAERRIAALAPQQAARPVVQQPVTKSGPRLSVNDRVRQIVSDRKILLRTHVGSVIPIVFTGDGRMRGQAGGLAFFLGSSQDSGRWWIAKGKLCQKWRVWLSRETHCMKLKERGGTIWWRSDDGNSGTARIVTR